MRIHWISALPGPNSLNARLRDEVLPRVRARGHDVVESDLYAMGWNPVVSPADALDPVPAGQPTSEWQRSAHREGRLAPEIVAEQDKLQRAELVVFQFPLWWYGPPAILKGWFDRVLVSGFAFGLHDPVTGRVRKFGDGGLAGRRALAVVTAGDRPGALGPRGISGHIEDVLWPVLRGTLHYTGMAPLRPHLLASVHHWQPGRFEEEVDCLVSRVAGAAEEEPMGFRTLAGGDYGDDYALRAEVAPGVSGNAAHRVDSHLPNVPRQKGRVAAEPAANGAEGRDVTEIMQARFEH